MRKGLKCAVWKGDITLLTGVDAIVNAANSWLGHGGGIARAIRKAGGSQLVEQSQLFIAENGALGEGEVCHTTGGSMGCRWVIHAVGPIWRQGLEHQLLSRAFGESLRRADDLGLTSVAMPLISSGIFGFDKDEAATILFNVIKEFRAHNALQQCIICANDEETFAVLLKHHSLLQ